MQPVYSYLIARLPSASRRVLLGCLFLVLRSCVFASRRLFFDFVPCADQYRLSDQALDCAPWSITNGKHWTLAACGL